MSGNQCDAHVVSGERRGGWLVYMNIFLVSAAPLKNKKEDVIWAFLL
jgi:hypothetical protein